MGQQTRTTTITIGSLRIMVRAAGLGGETLDTAGAAEFEAEVEFKYAPGARECDVTKVTTTASLHFEGDFSSVTIKRGTDISSLFSGSEIYQMADRILESIEKSK